MSPTVSIERIIPAPPRAVFDAWLDPGALARFMFPADGGSVSKAETDPRVGGKFLIVMQIGEKALPHRGTYLVVEPHQRLVFTWHSHVAGEGSRVSLSFEAAANGHTKLTLLHEGLEAPALPAHDKGWASILTTLAALAAAAEI